jgi:hypothetical protein
MIIKGLNYKGFISQESIQNHGKMNELYGEEMDGKPSAMA